MARIDSLSIELQTNPTYKDKLKEEYGKVIENIQKNSLAYRLKNTDLSGDPNSGTVEAKRFANATEQNYGTARTNGRGSKVKAKPVIVALDTDKELIEEVEEKDLQTYGINGLIEKRTKNHEQVLEVALDREFFAEAVEEGTSFVTTKTNVEDIVEEAIGKVEKTHNDFVEGVPRNMINVICSTDYYGALRTKINTIGNSQNLVSMSNYEEGVFNNTRIFSSVFLPEGIDFVVMVDGSVAQPIKTSIYNPKKVDLSDATAFGMFTYRGTKAVTPDLIIYQGTPASL